METAEPVTGEYPDIDEPRLPLQTVAEALQAIGYLRRLGTLDTTHHGYAANQLAHDLAGRVPSP
ncbi:hypothetical protein ACFQ69_35000 [Streptomyces sp. NPDC056470]|uniref:hypothetical protein n=1 Tax=Streptomyces sp. NPDC056470 TaxID=3345831 RepID=UPI003679C252